MLGRAQAVVRLRADAGARTATATVRARPAAHHAARRRPGARAASRPTTDAELVDGRRGLPTRARRAAAGPGRRQQPRRRRRGLRRHGRAGRAPAASPRAALRRAALAAWRPASRWDDVVARRVAEGCAGLEALSGIPGSRRRDPDPERRRLRPGGRPDRRARCATCDRRPTACIARSRPPSCGFGYRTAGSSEPGRYVVLERDVRLRARRPVRAGPLRRARRAPSASRSAAGAPAGRRARGGARPAPRARAWCSTPPTTTPGAPARSSPTRCSTRRRGRGACPADAPRWPAAGRPGQDARRVADRAGRLRPRLRRAGWAGRGAVHQAHPRADQPRRRATADLLALARKVRDGVGRRSALASSRSRCSWAARSTDHDRPRAGIIPEGRSTHAAAEVRSRGTVART